MASSAVALFCLLSTLSTAFEHTIKVDWRLIDGAYQPCNQTLANVSPTPPSPSATPALATPPLATPATIWQVKEQEQEQKQDFTTAESSTAKSSRLLLLDIGSGSGDGEPGE